MPIEKLFGEDLEDTRLLQAMAADTEKFLESFEWCKAIEEKYFSTGIGGVVAIFFFGIDPKRPQVVEWLWVVVGDLPSAYLVTDNCECPSKALEAYIWNMRRWSRLAKPGKASPDVIPVNVPATPKWAKELEGRLNFLEQHILRQFRDDEVQRA